MSYYQYSNPAEFSVGSTGYKPVQDTCNSYSYLSPQLEYNSSRGYSQSSGHYTSPSSGYSQSTRSNFLTSTGYNQSQTVSSFHTSTSYTNQYSKTGSNYGLSYSTPSHSYRRPIFGDKSSIMSLDTVNVDPVTKAVINNMMGTTSAKFPKPNLKCTVCGITSLSQATMDTHLAGAKHARRVKEKELDEQNALAEHPAIIKKGLIFHCTVCDTDVNSLHQLQSHVNGTKHKTKLSAPAGTTNNSSTSGAASEAGTAASTSTTVEKGSGSGAEEKPKSEAKEITQYYCPSCNVCSNSETQYEQHVTSRKHHLRSSGKKVPRKPYSKLSSITVGNIVDLSGQANGYPNRYRQQQLYSRQPVPLSATFVSGGLSM